MCYSCAFRPLPFCLSELLKQCDPGIFESVQELDVDSKQFHQICAYLLSWKLIVDYMLSVPAEVIDCQITPKCQLILIAYKRKCSATLWL